MSLRRFRKGDQLPADLSKAPDKVELKVYAAFDGWRLDRYLDEHVPWNSRTRLQQRIVAGEVSRNGVVVRHANRRVRLGDQVRLALPPPTEDLSVLDQIELPIIHEDDWYIGVNKPANLLVHPVGHRRFTSVLNILHRMYRNTDDPRRDVVPMLAHRIDQETTGVLLCTKSKAVKAHATKQLMKGLTRKRYVALIEGHITPTAGLIDLPLGPRPDHEIHFARGLDHRAIAGEARQPGTQEARSAYRVVRRLPGFDVVQVQLLTGRQHQIRLHFEALGHPLVGDRFYGRRTRLTRAAVSAARAAHAPAPPPPLATVPLEDTADADAFFADLDALPVLAAPAVGWRFRRTMIPETGPDPYAAGAESEAAFLADPDRPAAMPFQRAIGFPTDPDLVVDRVALHSTFLELAHGFREGALRLHAPLPPDMARAIALLGAPLD